MLMQQNQNAQHKYRSVYWAILLLLGSLFSGQILSAQESSYNAIAQRAKLVDYPMVTDLSFLSEEEKAVLNKLFIVSDLMSHVYTRQLNPANPTLLMQLNLSRDPLRSVKLDLFSIYLSPWDSLANNQPFFSDFKRPPGAGFYPDDISKAEFEQWIAEHPEDAEAFKSLYTVIRRDGKQLLAWPYSEIYRHWLMPAADILKEAAALSSNASLKKQLEQAAKAFLSNSDEDYEALDVAWMTVKDTPIEVVIGPYEVYADELFGYKAAFQAFITVKNPKDTAILAHLKKHLKDMEAHLPMPDEHKNLDKSFSSPIVVTNQIHAGGFAVPGPPAIAFNLPNNAKVKAKYGSKNVILKNLIKAKFHISLKPIGKAILAPQHADELSYQGMFYNVLFHELAHAIGPGEITKDGKATTVSAELKDLNWPLEETKADVMGIYNLLYLLDYIKQNDPEMADFTVSQALSNYIGNLFRSMRFGIGEAHGRAAAVQYRFYRENHALRYDATKRQFYFDPDNLQNAIPKLLKRILMLQIQADYDVVAAFMDSYAQLDGQIQAALAGLHNMPVDIRPLYPESL